MRGSEPDDAPRLCHHCDLLLHVPDPGARGKAYCPRCGTLLESGGAFPAAISFPLLLTALILLVLAVFSPFLGFEASGRENQITLAEGISNVFHYDEPVFALLAFVMVVIYPAILIGTLLLLTGISRRRTSHYHFPRTLLKWTQMGTDWAMVEVFIISIMISLVKISSTADIQLGEGFFLYCVFAVIFTITVRKIDMGELWKYQMSHEHRN